jgi:ADP-ribosylglycohydrolase
MIEILEGARTFPGADDDQLQALTKVPVLFAAYSDNPDAVRRNIYACGDSCGRAMVVGSLGGALFGGIPDDWRTRVTRREEISGALDTIVS